MLTYSYHVVLIPLTLIHSEVKSMDFVEVKGVNSFAFMFFYGKGKNCDNFYGSFNHEDFITRITYAFLSDKKLMLF